MLRQSGVRSSCNRWSIRSMGCVMGLATLILLSGGCQKTTDPYDTASTLPTRVASAQDPGTLRTLNRLTSHGVTVISIGQNYLISIPANRLFPQQSPRIIWESYALLNDVVCYLQQFRKIDVDVSAFSSKYVSPTRERALTAARAKAVADYLWSQDIDSRFVFTRGLGSDKPILFRSGDGDASPNARVEITFRNAVA